MLKCGNDSQHTYLLPSLISVIFFRPAAVWLSLNINGSHSRWWL